MDSTVLRGLIFNITLSIVPAGDNDGQVEFSAQLVTGRAYRVVTAFVGMIVLVGDEADRIKNQMVE